MVFLISCRSMARSQRPKKLYLHIDEENTPTGVYFERLQKEIPCLELRRTKPPQEVFGNPLELVEHKADIYRHVFPAYSL